MDTDNVGIVSVGSLGVGELEAWGPAVADDVCRLGKEEGRGRVKERQKKENKGKREGGGAAGGRGCIVGIGRLGNLQSTCLVISSLERGGRKEKVSKNL